MLYFAIFPYYQPLVIFIAQMKFVIIGLFISKKARSCHKYIHFSVNTGIDRIFL